MVAGGSGWDLGVGVVTEGSVEDPGGGGPVLHLDGGVDAQTCTESSTRVQPRLGGRER